MELRILRNFLEIAREGNISSAARRLHISQPSLSRQIRDLEDELGKKLFVRSSHSITLTQEGLLLKKRARDLVELADQIESEFSQLDSWKNSSVNVGAAESWLIQYLGQALNLLKADYPHLSCNIFSGDSQAVYEKLQNGLIDMAFICQPPDSNRYDYVELPEQDVFAVFMPADHPLAQLEKITAADLIGYDLITTRQAIQDDLSRWAEEQAERLTYKATCNLAGNGAQLAKSGLGLLICFEQLVETCSMTPLTSRPLDPPLTCKMYLIWKKYQVLPPASQLLLDTLRQVIDHAV